MAAIRVRPFLFLHTVLLCLLVAAWPAAAGQARPVAVTGTITDPLGAPIAGAAVALVQNDTTVASVATDAKGGYVLPAVAKGRYEIAASAERFSSRRSEPFVVGSSGDLVINLVLSIGVKAEVIVTAAAAEVPDALVAAPVTVIDRDTTDVLAKPDVSDALRLVPGVHVSETGARGGPVSLFIRGGSSNFNKVLIDGVPANDIGGRFDFGDLSLAGVDRVEVLRDANSVIHGSDAIAGVVGITTRRGQTRIPEFTYSGSGGNLGTYQNAVTFGGAARRVDYFATYSDFQTNNEVPNNADRNRTFATRVGYAMGGHTLVSGVVRWYDTRFGSPNATAFYGIADDSTKTSSAVVGSVTAESRLSNRWDTTLRFSALNSSYHTVNPAPTGMPYDPFGFGANYLGDNVTITGANGYSVSGRAVLDFSGAYPMAFHSNVMRQLAFGQATYHADRRLDISFGGRAEHESGFTEFFSKSETHRNNGGGFVEARAAAGRAQATVGVGVEHNEIFGTAATPRVSAAYYLRKPSSGDFGDTKLTVNAGTGIKAPSIDQELSSLFSLLQQAGVPSAAVGPIGPERATTFDAGVDQGLFQGRARLRAAYFHNQFRNLIEFVGSTTLPQLGIPADAAAASGFGAYVNSSSYRAQGIELSADATMGHLRVAGAYTFLDAVVTASFSGSALAPSFNPAFPTIPIGAFSPLVGNRPFRIPTHVANILAIWSRGAFEASVSAYITGKRDDSTFLSDQDFGNSLLLPNQNMDAAFKKIDLSVAYRLRARVKWFVSAENVTGERYQDVAGFPGLPRTFRTGVTFMLGGDSAVPKPRR